MSINKFTRAIHSILNKSSRSTPSENEAKHTVVLQQGSCSIRRYDRAMLAQVAEPKKTTQGAFRALFQYISGANKKPNSNNSDTPPLNGRSEKISMTTPVVMSTEASDQRSMAFYLPSKYDKHNAPIPTSKQVNLIEQPASLRAVIQFSGRARHETIKRMIHQLKEWIIKQDYVTQGEPQLASYNPPWTLPPFRRNEIQIQVIKKTGAI